MKASTTIIIIIGAIPILFEAVELLWERLTYPYRIDDIGLPWAMMIAGIAAGVLAIGLLKWLLLDRQRDGEEISN
jgi:hypothetical protein